MPKEPSAITEQPSIQDSLASWFDPAASDASRALLDAGFLTHETLIAHQPFLCFEDFLAAQAKPITPSDEKQSSSSNARAFMPLFEPALLQNCSEETKRWRAPFQPFVQDNASRALAIELAEQQRQLSQWCQQFAEVDGQALSRDGTSLSHYQHYIWTKQQQQRLADNCPLQTHYLAQLKQLDQQLQGIPHQWHQVADNTQPSIEHTRVTDQLMAIKTQLGSLINERQRHLDKADPSTPLCIRQQLDKMAQQCYALTDEHALRDQLIALIEQLQGLPTSKMWTALLTVNNDPRIQQWILQYHHIWQRQAHYAHYTGQALHLVAYTLLPQMAQWLATAQTTLSTYQKRVDTDFYQTYLDGLHYQSAQAQRAVCYAIALRLQRSDSHPPITQGEALYYYDDGISGFIEQCQALNLTADDLPVYPPSLTHKKHHLHHALTADDREDLQAHLTRQPQLVALPPFQSYSAIVHHEQSIFVPNALLPYVAHFSWFKRCWLACFPSARRFIDNFLTNPAHQQLIALFTQPHERMLSYAIMPDDVTISGLTHHPYLLTLDEALAHVAQAVE